MFGFLSESEYADEFVYNYGEWNRGLAQDLWTRRSRSGSVPQYFAYSMLKRAMESAHLVIVHNAVAKRLAEEHGAARVEQIPHFIETNKAPHAADVVHWRAAHGLFEHHCLVGVFGHLRESKRVPALVRAMALRSEAKLLIQGEWGSAALRDSLGAVEAIRVGAVSERELALMIAAVDIGVNLRHPSAGESSGILARLMAAGKAAIVTQGEEHSHLPKGIVWPVPAGLAEHESLTCAIAYLAQHPSARREMGTSRPRLCRARMCGGSTGPPTGES